MPQATRGDVWIADLGMIGKVRPVLVLSVAFNETERALITCVPRTTSLRGTRFEIPHPARHMPEGGFECQQLITISVAKLERHLGPVDPGTLAQVERAVRAWLSL
jgi:mRNA interferase MazF